MKHFKAIFIIFLFIISFISCVKDTIRPINSAKEEVVKLAPDGFNFETSKTVSVNIRLLSNIDEPLKGILVNINTLNGETLLRGISDENGNFRGSVNIPAYIDTLLIRPDNTGLIQNVRGLIVNNTLNCTLGGKTGSSGNVVLSSGAGKVYTGNNFKVFAQTAYTYMGTYDINGRPVSYRESQKGIVSANLLSYLAESLPEQQDVRVHHPQYLSDNATEHLNIVTNSEIWITFVSEGAGNLNTVGYYTYPTNNPPNNSNKIDEIKLLFPNASASGSGGSMQSGDRVKLGTFSAGTSIGFVLISNGWSQSLTTVNKNNTKFYSDSPFNPESGAALKTHTVLLKYAEENQFIIGFEDLPRDNASCDQDFNDVILYATSNPANGISSVGVNDIAAPTDSDGDGVWNVNDKFPNDPATAYISYFPSETTKGTLAFEDNWPKKGDYDMNDLVIKYRYTYISNSNNKVVEMTADFLAIAAWAQNKNGFGVQLPFAQNLVSSVTGQKHTDNYITLDANGTEAGQAKAVIIPFDNHTSLIQNQVDIKDSVKINIKFTSPLDAATLGTAPYNPFLIGNKLRGYEVHLPGNLPTDKANLSFYGTEHDRSNPATNKYYLSAENWPWAISFTEAFNYPIEGNAINIAYLHFGDWATSRGTLFTDWYKNTSPGYRDQLKIYTKP